MISTDPALVQIESLNTWLATTDMHWALPMPEKALRATLSNSMVFGLYENPTGSSQAHGDLKHMSSVGIARCVTDWTTFLYLTDVYIEPRLQGKGLGTWLIEAVQEVIEKMPYLRRSLLFTSDWQRSVPFYQRLMKMDVVEAIPGEDMAILSRLGLGNPKYQRQA